MKPRDMMAVIARKRYSTETAVLLAGDDRWDGNNFERNGRQTFLYRAPGGGYFAVHQTCWQGEFDRIKPLSLDEAVELFEGLSERRVSFEEAFPGVKVQGA